MLVRATKILHTAAEKFFADGFTAETAQWLIDYLEERQEFPLGAILELDVDSGLLVPLALSKQGAADDFLRRDSAYVMSRKPRRYRGITGWVAATGISALSDDVRRDQRYMPMRDEIRSELCVPILVPGQILGVINTESIRPAFYTSKDLQLLQQIGRFVGLVMSARRKPDSGQITICAWCGCVLLDSSRWIVPEQQLLGLMGKSLSHGICPACLHRETSGLLS